MLKLNILIFGLVICQIITAQNSFEVNYTGVDDEFLKYTFETDPGDFISVGGKKSVSTPISLSNLILKINKYGDIVEELVYTKSDTNFYLQYGYAKANGNYFLIGTLTDSVSSNEYNITYVCERTPELALVWEKYYAIPQPYFDHRISNFIMDGDSNLIIEGSADTSQAGSDKLLFTMKFDKNGNRLDLNFYEGWVSTSSANEMIFNSDSSSIYFFGTFTTGVSVLIEFIEMDLDLNITDYINIIDWDHFCGFPVTVKLLPDANFVMANRASVEPGADIDLYIKVMDEDFNTLRDTLLFYPEWVYITVYEGMGFIDQNVIWVPTFQPAFNSTPGTEVFRFHIFDSNLNLIGLKEYGGDQRYWFNNMIVTSDGGCLLTGQVPDYNGSYNDNGYIIKVMPEDIITTHAEDTPIAIDKDVLVYPNPFNNEIRFQTVRKNLTFELYDLTGKKIKACELNHNSESKIVTGNINHGIYFYTIQDDNGIIQSGKLIRE